MALCVAVFLFWLLAGRAVLALVQSTPDELQSLLLAPAVGLAITVVPLFLFNRLGLPVAVAGPPLLIGLLAGSVAALAWRRPAVPVRLYLPFLGVLTIALLASGWPLLELGFDWIGFASDDMANYALGATFFLTHAYPNVPSVSTLVDGTDYSQYYWFFYVGHGIRPGAEILLATLIRVTGLSGQQAFMPLILAFHLTLISAAAGIATQRRQLWPSGLLTAGLLAVSAMSTFAVVSQLLAQVAGLGLMAAAASFLLVCYSEWLLRDAILVGLLGASLVVVYPEIIPFLVLGFVVFAAISVIQRSTHVRRLFALGGFAALVAVILVNTYLLDVYKYMAYQVTEGLQATNNGSYAFPYFLVPTGLADFWGFQSITGVPTEPFVSAGIAAGAVLLAVGAVAAAVLAWRGNPLGAIACAMLLVSARLFSQSADFGVFKVSMFLQPFLLGCLAVTSIRLASRSRWILAPVIAIGLAGLWSQASYVQSSRGVRNDVDSETWTAMARGLHESIKADAPRHVVLDTMNITVAKLEAQFTVGLASTFPSRDFFSSIVGQFQQSQPGLQDAATAVDSRVVPATFDLHDPSGSPAHDDFRVITIGADSAAENSCDLFISTGGAATIFNRRQSPDQDVQTVGITRCADVQNHVIFIHSRLGQHFYQVDPGYFGDKQATIGLFPLEPDPLAPGRTMAGVGRYLLLELVNPSSPVRIAIDLTTTMNGEGQNVLPPAAIIGNQRVALPLEGNGAARVVSPPLEPQIIDGRAYVAVDMGADPRPRIERRQGLMALFHTDIPLDNRRMVAYARDISAISNTEYAQLAPPQTIQTFPNDLLNQSLEFSGIYEDGWVSSSASMRLAAPADSSQLVVRGLVPALEGATLEPEVRILVDGQEVARQMLGPGEFQIQSRALQGAGLHDVDLQFSQSSNLPAPDDRPIAAHLESIGLVPLFPTEPPADVQIGAGWYPLETFGGQTFRWVGSDAQIEVVGDKQRSSRVLRLEVEPGPGVYSQPFTLDMLDAQGTIVATILVQGHESIELPVSVAPGETQTFTLHVEGGGAPAPNDPRTLNFRVFALQWSPS